MPDDIPSIYVFFRNNLIRSASQAIKNDNDAMLHYLPKESSSTTNRIYLSTDDFQPNLRYKYDEVNLTYEIDEAKSYVLQFEPGGFYPYSSKVLHRGRLYGTTSYFVSNGEMFNKDELFKSWIDKVFRMFKKDSYFDMPTTKAYYSHRKS